MKWLSMRSFSHSLMCIAPLVMTENFVMACCIVRAGRRAHGQVIVVLVVVLVDIARNLGGRVLLRLLLVRLLLLLLRLLGLISDSPSNTYRAVTLGGNACFTSLWGGTFLWGQRFRLSHFLAN